MNEEELKKEIELVNVWFNDDWDNVKIFENMIKKANDLFSNKNTLESYREYLNAKLEGFQKGKLKQKKEELKIINELIKELSKFEYMEKDGYCLEHKKWEDNTNCITKNDFLANYCETSDVAGAIKILIQLQKEIGGNEK